MDAVQVTTGDETACAVVNDPFGEPIATNGNDVCASGSRAASTGNTYGYRGQSRDGSTGKYQMGARTYDPATGAFTAPDAYRISDSQTDTSVGTDPLTANTYSYVNGNPLNLVDPSGHFAECLRGCSAETRKFLTKTVRDQVKNHSKRSLKDQEKDVDKQQADLNKQKRDAESKLAKGFEWGKALGKFLADVSGLTDIKRCIMDGDVKSCVMSVAGIVGASVFKLGKLYKGVRAAIRSYRAFDRARDAAQDTLRSVKAAEKALDATRKALAAERRAVKARSGLRGAKSVDKAQSVGRATKGSKAGGRSASGKRPMSPPEVEGGGTVFTHFTDAAGAEGISGVAPLKVGDSVSVDRLAFGQSENSFQASALGDNFVTDLSKDATPRELDAIGVFGEKQQYALQFSQEAALTSGVRPRMVRQNIYTIPADSCITGACTVTRVR